MRVSLKMLIKKYSYLTPTLFNKTLIKLLLKNFQFQKMKLEIFSIAKQKQPTNHKHKKLNHD